MHRPPPRKPPVHQVPGYQSRADRRREHDRQRGNSSQRGYGSRWQAARKRFLADPANVLCRHCEAQGRITKATDVDHVIPARTDPSRFWDESNWMPLCHSCHSAKTATEGTGKGLKGCDVEGLPLDPSHPWAKTRGGASEDGSR